MKVNELDIMKEIADLQEKYQNLIDSKALSKKALCELCIPFRDKYKLSDGQTLQIARNELSLSEIVKIIYKEDE